VRLAVAQALPGVAGDPPAPAVVAALVRLTDDADDEVREWATFGLGSSLAIDSIGIRGALWRRVDDEHHDTRAEAMLALARRGDERVVPAVLAALTAQSVGRLAVEAAALLPSASLLPALLGLRSWWDVDPPLLEQAIRRCSAPRT
jgi:HEAT repeat protein